MPSITNLHDLPAPIVEAILNDDYTRGEADISATGLLTPPRITALEAQYAEHLSEDASERIWLLLGKGVHYAIERSSSYGLSEERYFTTSQGWTVSGQFDHLSLREEECHQTLNDWKVTSVWTLVYGDRIYEWEAQLNLYALLLHEAGIAVDNLEVIAILRDWQQSKKNDDGYPPFAVQSIPLMLWSPEEARRFLDNRVALHQQARTKLPKCTDEERWAKPSKYAVYKTKKDGTPYARADRLFDAAGDAEDHATKVSGVVEFRQGDQWTRCRNYCPVAQFCTQFMEGQ